MLNRLYLVYRLFGFNSAQIVVQVFVLTVQVRCIPHTVAEGVLDGKRCLPPCIIVVEQYMNVSYGIKKSNLLLQQ